MPAAVSYSDDCAQAMRASPLLSGAFRVRVPDRRRPHHLCVLACFQNKGDQRQNDRYSSHRLTDVLLEAAKALRAQREAEEAKSTRDLMESW